MSIIVGPRPSAQFTPLSIAGLQLWLDAGQGITLNGSNVSQWNDLSGNGNHAVQLNAGYQPAYVTNQLNGKPIIRFTDQKYFNLPLTIKNNQTFFIVWKKNSGTYGPTFSKSGVEYFLTEAGGSIYIRDNNYISFLTDINSFNCMSTILTLAGVKLFKNGQQIGTEQTLSYNLSFDYFGTYPVFTSGNIDYAEILHYDGMLSETNQQLIETYLNTKYALW